VTHVYYPPPRTMSEVRDDPQRFPRSALPDSGTALCVFAAEWHGRQDAYWLAEAGLQTTCVDLNAQKLDEMKRIYPDDWEFVTEDAFAYLPAGTFDVVTLDPFTGDPMERCHRDLKHWCGMANLTVIMGSTASQRIPKGPPGWRITDIVTRSSFGGGVFWTVLRKLW
jgi:hypothetical protein